MKRFLALLLTICSISAVTAQATRIDSLLQAKTAKPFNGVILVAHGAGTLYTKAYGFSNREQQAPMKPDDQFYIGSISKQITAVLTLQQIEQGHMGLNDPIRKYLPQLTESWADTVTIHHLLSHTSGIVRTDKSLAFRPGSAFAYSNLGFELLAKCIEKASGQSFAALSMALFKKCGMHNSFYPDSTLGKHPVTGYTAQEDGSVQPEHGNLSGHAASGTFISTAADLIKWNNCLHTGKLLSAGSYQTMITKKEKAVREHPVFGTQDYGYGITTSGRGSRLQLGQTGLIPGFVCMDFYYPASQTSIVVLENVAWSASDIKEMFYYHLQVLHTLINNE